MYLSTSRSRSVGARPETSSSSTAASGGGDEVDLEGRRAKEAMTASCICIWKAKSRSDSRVLAAMSSLRCSESVTWRSYSSSVLAIFVFLFVFFFLFHLKNRERENERTRVVVGFLSLFLGIGEECVWEKWLLTQEAMDHNKFA
ncbi:hypothetical protein PanWU01x14_138580 [Parasponia andersonii]|uniref:Transmembrane protein n=1 Tax=Parasponia andersonii TaxID=3476 RepID=A0A2P5CMS4_PARAD|nr:hypothetical protein PanWU01x14_138580 [Parasponia andersonii]